ncbi:type I-E CRISPR-associated protein Cas7/Cse4/CasC [Streptomyces sp. NPDC049954]|uniref:type I-E CRISPR-associated protein Cas7/Cse4/CasC n=1 Tax=Streptomyces sp. NPDC049954 TaxID=3155779 RepID=UPI003444E85A
MPPAPLTPQVPRAYVDVHIIQTVPPANMNRDDQGNPKDAVFGGVRRSRVSSQAWKRATRLHHAESRPVEDHATRTRAVAAALAERLRVLPGVPDEESAARLATALLAPLGIKAGKKEGDTAYLFFYGQRQLDRLVALIAERVPELLALGDKALTETVAGLGVQEVFRTGHPLDVALFGRMVADLASLRVDAATQVAHALSTHAVDLEFDYFTAVDDETHRKNETGAGMIGHIGFNSATLYRYATVGLHQLRHNLSLGREEGAAWPATIAGVRDFVTSFARSVPAGYGNSFAHRTLPSLVAVVVRTDQPVNLVSAFEAPVVSGEQSIAATSAARLADEHAKVAGLWGEPAPYEGVVHAFDPDDAAGKAVEKAFGPGQSFRALLAGLEAHLESAYRTGAV